MKRYFLITGTLLFLSFAAQAQQLLGDTCLPSASPTLALQVWAASASVHFSADGSAPQFAGLSCNDLRAIDNSYYLVSLSVIPALRAWAQSPALQGALAAELAGLGLAAGSPAVLGVTVIGGFGIVTMNILLKMSLEECEKHDREQLKKQIINELETRYGVRTQPQTTLQITH